MAHGQLEKMSIEGQIAKFSQKETPQYDSGYYNLTISCTADGTVERSFYTHFVGWADESRRVELRAASLVKPDVMLEHFRVIGIKCWIVEKPEELYLHYFLGGPALIEPTLSEEFLADELGPIAATAHGSGLGFEHIQTTLKEVTTKAPSKKLRMQVLQRDSGRCRVCGQSPNEDSNITLHLHHIRPWAKGGTTTLSNLISLCHTCHGGLDPHYNLFIANLQSHPDLVDGEMIESIKRYRARIKQVNE